MENPREIEQRTEEKKKVETKKKQSSFSSEWARLNPELRVRPGFRRLLFIGGEEIIPRCKLPSEHFLGRVVFLVKTE